MTSASFLSYKPIRTEDLVALYSGVKDSIGLTYHLVNTDDNWKGARRLKNNDL